MFRLRVHTGTVLPSTVSRPWSRAWNWASVPILDQAAMHNCHGKGHWKRECPQLLSHPGMFVVEINMISNSASWVLDTGCGAHICNDLQVLQRSRKLSKDEMILRLDVCGPLSIPARGGFSYFIIFTDDHSLYGYVYLMRYKSEAFGRFKEYSLEVEKQTSRKIKALRSGRGGEYLSGEFIDYLKENGILSQWTPPGTPQLNGVAERRNRTLLDMTPYEIWHGKPASYKYLRVWDSPAYVKRLVGDKLDSRSSLCRFIGYLISSRAKGFCLEECSILGKRFPSDNQRDEVLIEESSGEPPHNSTASFEPTIHTDGVPILRRSTRESRVPERYGFVGLTSQLDNDPKMYGEAMSDIDSDKWLEAMKSEMNSMGSNQVTAFKARLVAKGYTQRPGVDFEETYWPVAMAKSIRILFAIAAWYDYEIWQMDVKTAFLNSFVEEEIFMDQPGGFTTVGEEQKNDYDPCVCKKISGSSVAYLVLYVDDILLIGNDVKMLGDIKAWLST
ncbi:UNVERIFIED_CONTAM: Retrovirus-related Pol polyprotein from transposon RE2 [Sesamum radiatum]|uniref:Retrovirus-related Pol polyprotein from transposon RE2 n=1 Tax=Sesamum radiatum TaxID=300843 RepID=A0AAW2IUI7_SESRA